MFGPHTLPDSSTCTALSPYMHTHRMCIIYLSDRCKRHQEHPVFYIQLRTEMRFLQENFITRPNPNKPMGWMTAHSHSLARAFRSAAGLAESRNFFLD